MKKLTTISIFIFTILFSFTVVAQQMRSLRSGNKINIPKKIQKLVTDPLPAGKYTVGSGGDFPTIDSAFNKLSVDGIAGPVTLFLIDTLYTAPNDSSFTLVGPISGAGPNSKIILTPATNDVTIVGNGPAVLSFNSVSYLIIGYSGIRPSPSLKIHALYNPKFQWNDCVDFLNNSNHNLVELVIATSEDISRGSIGIAFWINDINATSGPDSNLICLNNIKKASIGIFVSGLMQNAVKRPIGNMIVNNSVGSETDSMITWGIQTEYCQNTTIKGNSVQNVRHYINNSFAVVSFGINSYWCNSSEIFNNKVYNISDNNSYYGAAGILLSGSAGEEGNNNLVYNNMIYDIRNSSVQSTSCAAGINIWNQNNPKIYYNSVYLSNTGSSPSRSSAFNVAEQCPNIDAKNNIFVNTREESLYTASSIYDYSVSNLTTNYNDLYCPQSQNNCVVKIGTSKYNQLIDWQALAKDVNSISEMPNFVNSDLHIDSSTPTNLESHGTPITGIDLDFDGDARGTTSTDIGADEFDGIVSAVETENNLPLEFALSQNYPNPFNPTTKIKYSIASVETHRDASVQLKVYDVLGREAATLVNETKKPGEYEIEFNAATLPSGVYFYQLKAGEFIQTKKMILLK